mmetsp:Transcript_122328/g.391332  ORF Transcript_122328/g.391332 Transcript_122328/m.391332 type:complete len:85 (-) Transcript_122328:39-293(-)
MQGASSGSVPSGVLAADASRALVAALFAGADAAAGSHDAGEASTIIQPIQLGENVELSGGDLLDHGFDDPEWDMHDEDSWLAWE